MRPSKQGSAHTDRLRKKNAAPYRRAHETSLGFRPAKQKRMRHGRCPVLTSSCRRPLLFTRTAYCFIYFVQLVRPENAGSVVRLSFAGLLLFSSTACDSPCGQSHPPALPMDRNPRPTRTARRICNRKCGAAPSWRAHEISLKMNPTNTGCDKLRNQVCPDIKIADVHCFSRALLVALFLTACFILWAFESIVRMACATISRSYATSLFQ